MGVLLSLLREIQMSTQVIWKYVTKNVKIGLIFQTLSLISPKWYVFCLSLYAWLESCDQDGSFGTKISGSLIVSPVLWVLSSRNTLSVTYSDTASYGPNAKKCSCAHVSSWPFSSYFSCWLAQLPNSLKNNFVEKRNIQRKVEKHQSTLLSPKCMV